MNGSHFRFYFLSFFVFPYLLLMSCGGNSRPSEPLSGSMEPRDAADITAFLDRHHEPYTLETEGRAVIIRVKPDRAKLLKEYLYAPVDSAGYINLVRKFRLSEKDSAWVHREPPKSVRKFTYFEKEHADSTRIGEAFDFVFEKCIWKAQRTRENDIVVEFTGTVTVHAMDNPFGKKVLNELTDHRDYLIAEVGKPEAVWKFRWRIGIEGKSFYKEMIRVTLGGKEKEKDRKSGDELHIDL